MYFYCILFILKFIWKHIFIMKSELSIYRTVESPSRNSQKDSLKSITLLFFLLIQMPVIFVNQNY